METRTYKDYEQTINEIESGLQAWKTCLEDKNCDKKAFGFNLDDRFSAHEAIKVRLTSWKGYYGNSGCSTIFSFRGDVFRESFVKYLNAHKNEILAWVVSDIKQSSKELRMREIAEIKKRLQELEGT